jgi:hypothetical protein
MEPRPQCREWHRIFPRLDLDLASPPLLKIPRFLRPVVALDEFTTGTLGKKVGSGGVSNGRRMTGSIEKLSNFSGSAGKARFSVDRNRLGS